MDGQSIPCVLFIVEDDSEDRLFFKFELLDSGFESNAYFFSDVYDLIYFNSTREQILFPSLILINAFVPVLYFRDVVTLIKNIPEFRSVPVLVMVSSEPEKEYLQSYNLDISGYVTKPVDRKKIHKLLQLGKQPGHRH